MPDNTYIISIVDAFDFPHILGPTGCPISDDTSKADAPMIFSTIERAVAFKQRMEKKYPENPCCIAKLEYLN